MTFNSVAFIFFLVVVLWLHWTLPVRMRNPLLLVASYVFYGWWDWRFLGLIALSTIIDFTIARRIAAAPDGRRRRGLLTVSLVANLGLLGVFKYAGFFVDSAADLLDALGFGVSEPALNIVLPIGISFYTFQTISYSIDVYRRRMEPTPDLLTFATYVSYFPQLVAGPIERARRLLPLIEDAAGRRAPRGADLDRALSLILLGFFKKIVLADGVAPFVDEVFTDPGAMSAPAVLFGAIAFSIQVYGDFSGYTDIGRGVSELFGIRLMVNFREPYLSRNITELWRRWHISLTGWLRDYVYVPLGGSRRGDRVTIRNVLITTFLSGVWHGAGWTFVVWGAVHGVLVAGHRRWLGGRVPDPTVTRSDLPRIVAVFLIWTLALIVFRADSLSAAGEMFAGLVRWNSGALPVGDMALVALAAAVMFRLDVVGRRAALVSAGALSGVRREPGWVGNGVLAGGMLVAIVLFSGGQSISFIYFQF